MSTVTGSPPQPRGGSSGATMPVDGVFPGSGFGPGSGYQAQTGYSVQPSHPHYGLAQQHVQPPAQALAHMAVLSQGQYQYEAVSALRPVPASGFANPQGRSEFQVQPKPAVVQPRTAVPVNRAPPVRTSTKRTRAPKRLRPAGYTGIGPSQGNLIESEDDSDDDEVIEWVPDWGGGSGAIGGAGTAEVGGSGGTIQVAPGPGGRKCVSLLFRCRFLLHGEV